MAENNIPQSDLEHAYRVVDATNSFNIAKRGVKRNPAPWAGEENYRNEMNLYVEDMKKKGYGREDALGIYKSIGGRTPKDNPFYGKKGDLTEYDYAKKLITDAGGEVALPEYLANQEKLKTKAGAAAWDLMDQREALESVAPRISQQVQGASDDFERKRIQAGLPVGMGGVPSVPMLGVQATPQVPKSIGSGSESQAIKTSDAVVPTGTTPEFGVTTPSGFPTTISVPGAAKEPEATPAPTPAAPAPVATPPTGSILPDVLSERTQDIGKSVDQKFTDKLAEDKKAAQAAQDARIAKLPTIQTPYGAIKATPEQVARFNKSPEMVQIEIDELRNRPYRKPVTDEEIKNLSDADFERRLKESMTPITRQEIQDKNALYESLQRKRNKLQEEARDERFLKNMDTLRKNRQAAMDEDRENFPEGKKGDKAFEAKWNSPAYRSMVDQQDQLFVYGRETPPKKENPEWFKAYQDRSVSMTGGGSGSDEVAREVDRMRRAETAARQRSMGRRVTSAGATRKSSTEELQDRAVSSIAGKRRVAEATQEARFAEEEAQQANSDLIKKYNDVAPDLNKEDVQDLIDKLGPEKAQSFLEKLRAKSVVGRQK